MGTATSRSPKRNGYKRSVRNWSTIGGTQVLGIGGPMFQLANRSLTDRSTTLAMKESAIAGRIGPQGMRTPTTYLYPRTTAGTHRVNYHLSLQVFLPTLQSSWQPYPDTSAPKSPRFFKGISSTSPQSRTRAHQGSLGRWTRAPCVRESIHPVQFGIFPKRILLPQLVDEILSGYGEDVSSEQDGYIVWVKEDPAFT